MANLTPAQQKVASELIRIGQRVGASPKEIKAALETAAVEKNFTNTGGGDRDSSNWRQERASVYGGQWAKTGGPLNLEASAKRFYEEAAQFNKTGQYGSAGQLAAAVQRPEAQYRGRYQEHSGLADALLGGRVRSGGSGAAPTGSPAPAAAPSGPPTINAGQAGDFTSLLSSLLTRPEQQRQAPAAIAPPSFAAHPVLPQGFTPAGSIAPPPMPAEDRTGQALALVGGLGGQGASVSSVQAPGIAEQVTDAVTPIAKRTRGVGAESALSWAKSKIGAAGSAESGGENHGKLADYANSRFGMSGQPWCAMFTSLAVTKGGAPASARTASVAEVRRRALAGKGYQQGLVDPGHAKSGDLILFGDAHIGMVDHVSGGKVFYVGGNQSDNVTMASVPVGRGDIVRPKYGTKR